MLTDEVSTRDIPARPALQLLEEGIAAMQLAPRPAPIKRESFEVIVIGAGQAGLAVGYHLARAGVRFVIVDAQERVGDSWRQRWDSLRLFSPAKFDSLEGMLFPTPRNYFPTKDEMANYLESYATHFRLPVRTGVRVEKLYKNGSRYVVKSAALEFDADHVVVAMSKYQRARLPGFAANLSREIVQIHSLDYRSPAQLKPGGVLLVGAGNSGADIAMEAARNDHPTWMSGPDNGEVPFRPESFIGRNLLGPVLLGFVFHRILTVKTPMGRKLRQGVVSKGAPLIRVKGRDLVAAGIERVPRVIDVRNGKPLLGDGRVLDVANVIWCTGFHAGFDWIDRPIFADHGMPKHDCGVVEGESGLYFVGLPFLYSMSSGMIHGVSRDAARIVNAITARSRHLLRHVSVGL